MAKGSDNVIPQVILAEGSAPSTSAAGTYPGVATGKQAVFIDSTDHKLKRVDHTGAVVSIESSGGGGGSSVVKQIVGVVVTTDLALNATTDTSTFVDMGISGTITVLAGSSVLLEFFASFGYGGSGTPNIRVRVLLGSTVVHLGSVPVAAGNSPVRFSGFGRFTGLSAGTLTYKVQYANNANLVLAAASAPDDYAGALTATEYNNAG